MGRGRGDVPANDVRVCAGCGRSITWRRAWADTWHEVRWCSDACRRRGIRPIDLALEDALVRLLDRAGRGATISLDDVIAEVGVDAQDLSEPARRAARRLVAKGQAEIVQKGRTVDPSTARGPILVRRPRSVG